MSKVLKIFVKNTLITLTCVFIFSCGDPLAGLPGGKRETPADGRERAKKNLEEGKGISLGKTLGGGIYYTEIYKNNLAKIKNPNLIYPGQVFNIPTKRNK